MKLKLIVVMLLSGLFGYSGYWYYISGNTDVFLEKAQKDMALQGVTFEYTSYQVSGFPYRLVLNFENPVFHYQNGEMEFELTAKGMKAIAQPWNFGHFIIFTEEALIEIKSSIITTTEIRIKPATLGFSINSLGESAYRLSSEMSDLKLTTEPAGHLPSELENISFHLKKHPPTEIENEDLLQPKLLEVAISGVTKTQNTFQFSFSFQGKKIPEINPKGLTHWKDQGGTLEINQFQFVNGSENFEALGSLTLDEKLRPLGAISITLNKSILAIYLMLNNQLGDEDKRAVATFIETLPETDGTVTLPLTLQGGGVYLGPARLLDLSPVIQE